MRVAIALIMAALTGTAEAQAVLDVAAVPNLAAEDRQGYANFLTVNLPRVFALGGNGVYSWYGGAGTLQAAREKALASCTSHGGTACAVYAEELQVVWHGRSPDVLTPVPGPLFGGKAWAFIPDDRFFWHGPAQARGVYVFSHGKNSNYVDARGSQPQSHVRFFNNQGFDVVRFDRDPFADNKDDAADWLRDGLRRVRALGYKMVVAGGQSRGGWNSLQILDTPGLADVVIAISAATNGISAGQQASQGQAELYRMFTAAKSPATRVAIVQFRDDEFEHNPDKRFRMADELLKPRVAALLKIDQPEGITGHGGGASQNFARRYGACLYRFATEPVPPTDC